MNNLRDLKGRQEFKGISITDDHTWNEREQIKKFMKDAKEQNLKEPETSYYVWKVRGTPKTGLHLKRLEKRSGDITLIKI